MSIFSSILSKIFPSSHPAVQNAGTAPAAGGGPATTTASAGSTGAAPSAMAEVDVEQVLNGLAQKNSQKLNWRTSIVDLMKLLDLDSSLGSRQQLAGELGYSGDKNDSASMNIWLHKQVMTKLAQNGGKVPADLKA
jgi:hypothetical protein